MPQNGIHSVTVPGAVDGWEKTADEIRKAEDSADVLAPARSKMPSRDSRWAKS